MSQLRTRKAGLVACGTICAFIFLYLRNPGPEEAEDTPTDPAVVDCGFYPDELCLALFDGKKAAPQIAQFCRPPPNSEVPAHLRTPGNCSRMARGLHFITRPLSAEERNFSLAYVIHAHKELAMFVRLLRAIYAPQNVYCIHIDEKAPKRFKSAVRTFVDCFGNVFLSSKTQKMVHDNLRRLQAEIDCMRDLVHSPFQWRYVMNLCGQEFPIKTNKEIIRYIRTRWKGKNITPGVIPPLNTKPKTVQSSSKPSPNENSYTSPNPMFKQKPPHNLTIYSGSAHYALTRKFVEFILTDPRARDMLQWSKDIHSPEQHYWVTLNRLKDAPGATPDAGWEGHIRATKQRTETGDDHTGCTGHDTQASCVFGLGDLPRLIQLPAFFATLGPSADPLVGVCLERRHRLKALQQAEVTPEPHWQFPQESHFNSHPQH
ncbi:beta-1,3-galactosyl-O-glycosyl-glycoprotein beta-1,6-N-acetylglucosaminyltransferase 7-like [Apodemus sylvaticus]|uniref:beta-1,3-galactosyl-O-glycosyl-glycoprotein beta-1,6-N-acetylglucosaminyltransferase 7-like n=1 Tax=Apodemus sylvaticus TaxID=10129 RepID=UPI002244C0EC|nr:beta-1,3-galactosyl-O-glycosyl-glycoprotein beta-1,6-N-acetylglucosaminyltransferase 7-like [Apodemus sylvaticus]